ncbi:MAG: DnaA/Hda family protein [Planctomycetota bacterium]|nr:DnaA/Hda family protein [Planctomycetota bacterium]
MRTKHVRDKVAEAMLRERLIRREGWHEERPALRNSPDLVDALGREVLRELGSERHNEFARIVRVAQYDGEQLMFVSHCELCRERFEKAYRRRVEEHLKRLTNRKLVFRCHVTDSAFMCQGRARSGADSCASSASADAKAAPRRGRETASMRFETFAVSPSNELAWKAARALLDARGGFQLPRPLLLWGAAGVGKTHLLHAIWQRALSAKPPVHPLLVTMPDFVKQFSLANKSSRQEPFRQKFRTPGMLLFDDAHLVPDTDAVQDELTHTIDVFLQGGKKMVFCSREHPRQMRHLRKRLLSRLCSFIDVRVRGRREFDESTAGGEVAGGGRASSVGAGGVELIRPEDIERLVGAHFGVRVADIRSPSKRRGASLARHVCYLLAREMICLTWGGIASAFGERHHSNVINACKRLGARLAGDSSLRHSVDRLRTEVGQLRS